MQVIHIDQNTQEWLDIRKGKITGSKLKDIIVKRGTERKIGFYQLIADELVSDSEEQEDPLERGKRLESEALEKFKIITKKDVVTDVFCVSDDNKKIALSPDGLIEENGIFTEAVEIKCLSSAKHIQCLVEQKIPDEYEMQVMQYFIVNNDLRKVYFVFYDPRVTVKELHYIEILRESMIDEIEKYKAYQIETIENINIIIEQISF